MRPPLMQAAEMTPIEKAERRVLVLANPGHGPEKMHASSSIYLGMQLLLPGEWTPAHRHTPNAVRNIVAGKGAYTKVEGEKCPMRRGDLIPTAAGLSHEYGHDDKEPVLWLDVLDLPLVYYMEASYVTAGQKQPVTREAADAPTSAAALRPRRCSRAPTSASRCCAVPGPNCVPCWSRSPPASLEAKRCRWPTSIRKPVAIARPFPASRR